MPNQELDIVGIQKDIGFIKDSIKRIEKNQDDGFKDLKSKQENFVKEVKETYTRKDEFALVRTIVYGMVGTILTLVLTALVYLVVKL